MVSGGGFGITNEISIHIGLWDGEKSGVWVLILSVYIQCVEFEAFREVKEKMKSSHAWLVRTCVDYYSS